MDSKGNVLFLTLYNILLCFLLPPAKRSGHILFLYPFRALRVFSISCTYVSFYNLFPPLLFCFYSILFEAFSVFRLSFFHINLFFLLLFLRFVYILLEKQTEKRRLPVRL